MAIPAMTPAGISSSASDTGQPRTPRLLPTAKSQMFLASPARPPRLGQVRARHVLARAVVGAFGSCFDDVGGDTPRKRGSDDEELLPDGDSAAETKAIDSGPSLSMKSPRSESLGSVSTLSVIQLRTLK